VGHGEQCCELSLLYPYTISSGTLPFTLKSVPDTATTQPYADDVRVKNQEVVDSHERVAAPPTRDSSILHTGLMQANSRNSLLRNIRVLLLQKQGDSLVSIARYHADNPSLQSARTYNLLLTHAIRHRYTRLVQGLSRQFRLSGLSPNWVTYKLWTRFHVQQGSAKFAFDELHRASFGNLERIPSEVLVEFLSSPPPSRSSRRDSSRLKLVHCEEWEIRIVNVIGLRVARQDFAVKNLKQPLRYVRLLVAWAVRVGNITAARKLVENVLRAIPQVMSSDEEVALLDVVHQLLAHAPIGTQSHIELRGMLSSFTGIRPSLTYKSTTLWVLLRTLRRTKNAGWQALKLVQEWKRTWGPSIEDSLVRRRVADFSLLEGRHDIAQQMANRMGNMRGCRPDQESFRHLDPLRKALCMQITYPRQGRLAREWKTAMLRKSILQRKWNQARRRHHRRPLSVHRPSRL